MILLAQPEAVFVESRSLRLKGFDENHPLAKGTHPSLNFVINILLGNREARHFELVEGLNWRSNKCSVLSRLASIIFCSRTRGCRR